MPAAVSGVPVFSIKVNGTELSEHLRSLLEIVVVDNSLLLPDMVTLRFFDQQLDVIDSLGVRIGETIVIATGEVGADDAEPICTVEVTGIEAEFAGGGSRAIVRGYDRSHRLHRGRFSKTFKNASDSDIVTRIVGEAGLSTGQIDSTGTVHDQVTQANLTNWEFLRARAREVGFEMSVTNGKFNFRKPPQASEAPSPGGYTGRNPLQLVWGKDLVRFAPRMSSSAQVGQVEVRAWDPKQKTALVGKATAATRFGSLSDHAATPAGMAGHFSASTLVCIDRPLATQDEATKLAAALADQIGGVFLEAEGTAQGNPKLVAGAQVSIGKVGPQFSGKYVLTHTRHVYEARRGTYHTDFTVSGLAERSLLGLASIGQNNGGPSASGPPINGVVVGLVTSNDDPEKQGRVKVKLPWLGEEIETDWIRMTQIGAGADSGVLFYPEVNDEVLLAFEFGDVRRPYVIGSLHNGKDKPKLGDGLFNAGKVTRRGIVSRQGHTFVIFDSPDKKGVAIHTAGGLKVSLNDVTKEIKVTGSQNIIVKSSGGDVQIEAGANVTIKGSANINVEASGQLSLKGTGGVTVDGGSGVVQVSGSAIMLG